MQARARATVDVLLHATARVLLRRGWAGLTTNHVAATAGVSIGTLYEYFSSKESLVHALVDAHLQRAEQRITAVVDALLASPGRPSLPQLVDAMVATMVELHADTPRLHRVLFEDVPHPPAVRRRVHALEQRVADVLARVLGGIEGVRVRDEAIAARVVVDVLEALTHRWLTDARGAPVAPERLAQELRAMLLAYLRG